MQSTKIKVSILSICTLLMTAGLITGILAEIAKHYSNTDMSVVSMALTLPFLMGTVFSFLAGPLSTKISKKTLILISLSCVLTGGLLGFLLGKSDIKFLLVASMFMGVSQGMMSTLSMALVADYFEGQESSALMGLSSAFVNFGGMIVMFIAALLSGINWNYAYLVVLLAVIPLVIVIRMLPKDAPAKTMSAATGNNDKLNGTIYLNVATVFFYGIFMFVFQANIAVFMGMNQLGDATAAGMVNSALVAAGGLTGIFYGRLSRVLKGSVLPVGIVVTIIGFLQLFFVGNIVSVYIAALCAGYGLTSVMPTAFYNVSASVSPAKAAIAIAMVNCACNVGIFLNPFVATGLADIFGNGSVRIHFLIGAIGLTLAVFIYLPELFRSFKTTKVAAK